MNLKNQRPVFVPYEFQPEMEKLSKAALMDVVWDYAAQIAEAVDAPDAIMDEFRRRRDIVLSHRRLDAAATELTGHRATERRKT